MDLSLPELLIQINEKKELYKTSKRKMVKRDKRQLKKEVNSMISRYNQMVKFKAIQTL